MKSLLITMIVLSSAVGFAKNTSVYTSVKTDNCKTIAGGELDPNAEIDYYAGLCAGKAGYTVKVSGGDLRYGLSLIFQGQEVEFTNIGAFHSMGADNIEWRGLAGKKGEVVKFNSLIYRLNVSNYSEESGQPSSNDFLYVVRLNGLSSCVIGLVPSAANMNLQARAIADDASAQCLAE